MHMKRIALFILSMGIGFSMLAGCEKTEEAKETVVPVNVMTITTHNITRSFKYTGKAMAEQQAVIMSRAVGKVIAVHYDLGDPVHQGDILFSIDKSDMEKNVTILEKQLEAAKVSVDMAQSALISTKGSQQQSQISRLEASLKSAEIAYMDAEKAYKDISQLYAKGSVSKQQYDQSRSGYEQAGIALNSARDAYDLFNNSMAEESIKASENTLKQAQINYEIVQAQLKNARDGLQDTYIKSPIDGVVSGKTINEGDFYTGVSPPFTIVNMDNILVDVNVTERVINTLEKDQSVSVYMSSASEESFEGIITAISPAADERTLAYPVKIMVQNSRRLIKPGMFAEVVFDIEKSEDVIVVPRNAVMESEGEQYIFAVQNDEAFRIKVRTGIDTGMEIEVTEGLEVGMTIVIKGQNYLQNGTKVKIVNSR